MLKILITGSKGQLGSHFNIIDKSSLFNFIKTHKSKAPKFEQMDVTNEKQVSYVLNKYEPDIIINTATLTNVDLCQDNKLLARKINVDGLKYLIKHSNFNTKIIQISSDFIYDGIDGNYNENSQPNPINYYGKTKLEAENILLSSNKKKIIIRVSTLFSNYLNNFYNWVCRELSKNNNIHVVDDQISNPCYALNLTNFIYDLILLDYEGKINFGSKNSISRSGFAYQIAKVNNLDDNLIKVVKTSNMNFKALRPHNTSFDLELCNQMKLRLFNSEDTLKYINGVK